MASAQEDVRRVSEATRRVSETQAEKQAKAKAALDRLVHAFLAANPTEATVDGSNNIMLSSHTRTTPEFEIRFQAASPGGGSLGQSEYDRSIAALLGAGFVSETTQGTHMLRIQLQPPSDPAKNRPGGNKPENSYIRAELMGLDLIQEYCRHNSLQKILDLPSSLHATFNKLKFTQKSKYVDSKGTAWDPVDVDDFGFRASFQVEEDFAPSTPLARELLARWSDGKKTFRYMNRVRFRHPDWPVFADVSVVQSNKTMRSTQHTRRPQFIATHTLQESEVLRAPKRYEVELELDNTRIGVGTAYATPASVLAALRKSIRVVLSGLQGTPYPIGFGEMEQVTQDYMRLLHGPGYQPRRVTPRDFVGPSSRTLQLENLVEVATVATVASNVRTVLHNYTVTDKADGERRLMFVAPDGRVYMIDTNMRIIFTGTKVAYQQTVGSPEGSKGPKLENTLIDGEWIRFDRHGRPIPLYAAFDIYFIDGRNVRDFRFMPPTLAAADQPTEPAAAAAAAAASVPFSVPFAGDVEGGGYDDDDHAAGHIVGGGKDKDKDKKPKGKPKNLFRLLLLNEYVTRRLQLVPITDASACPQLRVKVKEFFSTGNNTIFEACDTVLLRDEDSAAMGGYDPASFASMGIKQREYRIDGLIFTPADTAVGSDRFGPGTAGPLHKHTWDLSFKWKPPEFNTIDFLVTYQRNREGQPVVHHHYQEGRNMLDTHDVAKYQVLVLRVGFDPRKHGFVNPWLSVIEDDLPSSGDLDNYETYQPVPFQPTNPSDPGACFAHVPLHDLGGGRVGMKTEEDGEVFEEDTIVEFRYDLAREGAWKWVPIRVRHDKTNELRAGEKNYGNAYHVANANWASIHQPISEDMIRTGNGLPTDGLAVLHADDVYYHRGQDSAAIEQGLRVVTSTAAMRDFHNLYIKKKLIVAVSNPNDTLIDYAVGKAGDLPKWIQARLKFVLGIDISKDNIQNRLDGACARYLKACRKNRNVPGALFVQGNSAVPFHRGNTKSHAQGALHTDKDREIMRAVFGQGPKDPVLLGKGVHRHYGAAADGFHVSSVQFALHYFFETRRALHAFMHNLSDCTRVGGYCIGTCYDGQRVFDALKGVAEGSGFVLTRGDRKMFEITRRFAQTGFPDDELSLGYAIDVYQDSINKTFREYLVNYTYLTRIMEDYGFVPITAEEATQMGLPGTSNTFDRMFDAMLRETERTPGGRNGGYGSSADMTEDEKRISFLNRYFVFKKVRNVNLETMHKNHILDPGVAPAPAAVPLPATAAEAPPAAAATDTTAQQVIRRKLPKQRITITAAKSTQ